MGRYLSQITTLEALQFNDTILEDRSCLSKAVGCLSALTDLRVATPEVVTTELVGRMAHFRTLRALDLTLQYVSYPPLADTESHLHFKSPRMHRHSGHLSMDRYSGCTDFQSLRIQESCSSHVRKRVNPLTHPLVQRIFQE